MKRRQFLTSTSAAIMTAGVVSPMFSQRASAQGHASGTIDVTVDYTQTDAGFQVKSAGLIRTARKIAAGKVFVPKSVWAGV